MQLYKYKNYQEYEAAQIATNAKRFGKVQWVKEEEIKVLAEFLKKHLNPVKQGICHGVRSGREQEWFSKYLEGAEVIGTEIAPTCKGIPNTIQWDFHMVKQEWLHNMDFIYSNSFDHSYDPRLCLDQWMSCIKYHGICLIEWVHKSATNLKSDPFWAALDEYYDIITGQGYRIMEVLPFKGKRVIAISHPRGGKKWASTDGTQSAT